MSGCYPSKKCYCGCHPALEGCGDCCLRLQKDNFDSKSYVDEMIKKTMELVHNRIDEIEEEIDRHMKFFTSSRAPSDNYKRIEELEKIQANVFDICGQLDERIRQASDWMLDKQENLKYLDKRIERLESSKLSQEVDPKVWVFVNERLDKLESKTMLIIEIDQYLHHVRWVQQQIGRLDLVINSIDKKSKSPHCCPVCEGKGLGKKYADILIDGVKMQERHSPCNACDGKGIAWG